MQLDLFAEFAVFFDLKFTLSFCIHVNFIPACGVILVLTNGTN